MREVSGRGFVCEEKPEHRRPRGHLSGSEAGRPDRRALGTAGAVAAGAVEAWPTALVEQAAVDRRYPVAGAHRRPVAGHAAGIRILGGGVWTVPALAAQRCLATNPDHAAGPGRCRRADHLGCQRGLHDRAGASACRGCAEKGDLQAEPPGGVTTEPDDHALGRSRGGWTTKLHLSCEQGQKPLSILLTAGQRGDSPQFIPVLHGIRVPRLTGGRARTRPDRVLADKAYTAMA